MTEVDYYETIPVLETDEQVRVEAADWLKESVKMMNENGLHWVQSHYRIDKKVSAEEAALDPNAKKRPGDHTQHIEPYFTVRAWCMMGGLQEVRDRRLANLFKKFGEVLGLSYKRKDYAVEELIAQDMWARVYAATEVALAWASLLHTDEDLNLMNNEAKFMLIKASMVDPEVDSTLFSEVVDGYDPEEVQGIFHEVVTNANDANGTYWKDIAKIHEIAVTGLLDGKAPFTWKGYGEMLAEAEPKMKDDAERVVAQERERQAEQAAAAEAAELNDEL